MPTIPINENYNAKVSKDEMAKKNSLAGKAGVAARRRKKAEREENRKIAEIMRNLLDLPLKQLVDKNGNPRPVVELQGAESLADISSKNVRTKVALGLALIKEGLEGNIKAVDMALRMAGDETNVKKEINLTGGLPVIIAGEDRLED